MTTRQQPLPSSQQPAAGCRVWVAVMLALGGALGGVSGGGSGGGSGGVSGGFFGLGGSEAQAQTQTQALPNAGSLLRDQTPADRALPPTLPQPPAAAAAAEEAASRVEVQRFVLEGATLIPQEELLKFLTPLQGKAMSLAELQGAANQIAEAYRQRGWVVRVWLPEQEIKDGVMRISVLEGKLGGVRIEGGKDSWGLGYAAQIVTHRLKLGDYLKNKDLERGLLLANDLPGAQAEGVLEPGEQPGETQLHVQVRPGKTYTASVNYDNNGARATGTHQLGASLMVVPTTIDQFTLRASSSDFLQLVDMNYQTAVGFDGARITLEVSQLRYALRGNLAALTAEGTAQTLGATLMWPALRTPETNLYLAAGLHQKRFNDDNLGQPLRRRSVDTLGLEAYGDRLDAWGGAGRWDASAKLTLGIARLGDEPTDLSADQLSAQTEGGFHKIGLRLSRLQAITSDTTLNLNWRGQLASKNLVPSEKMALGGPYAVRAYPVGEAAGDDAWLFSAELRHELGDGWRATLFYDAGWMRTWHNPWPAAYTGSTVPENYILQGAGVRLGWSRGKDLHLDLTVAAPLGTHPGRQANGANQDGGTWAPQVWLTAVLLF